MASILSRPQCVKDPLPLSVSPHCCSTASVQRRGQCKTCSWGIRQGNAKTESAMDYPDSKVHGANMRPIWGQQDHVGSMNFAIWVVFLSLYVLWKEVLCVQKPLILSSWKVLQCNKLGSIVIFMPSLLQQGKSDGFDSCDRPSNLTSN